MQPFLEYTGIAAVLDRANVDTDMVIPKQFLKTLKRTGLGQFLFQELRYNEDGERNKSFILNIPPYDQAGILISGKNFGCGSSREHAPWALLDFGIRCVIAESFADIFFDNCCNNGLLAVSLPAEQLQQLRRQVQQSPTYVSVSLVQQQVVVGGYVYPFSFAPERKQALLEGLDPIERTLRYQQEIDQFRDRYFQSYPWLEPITLR